ncbi:MAG: response regulator transcription factor [bacterium]|nr:response regulator transcription factor [bacterium]
MKILIADDERELARAVSVVLKHSGYDVECAYDGAQAIEMFENNDFDAYILDIMMPKKNGIEVLKYIRAHGVDSPVIMLSAKSEIDDRIKGLDSGADDYMTKPFSMGELLARIRAATRKLEAKTFIQFGNLSLNQETREMKGESSSFRLGNLEFEMLMMLIKAAGREIEAERFIEKVWDGDGDLSEVKLYISYLRKKMEALDSDMMIAKSVYDSYRLERKTE